MSNARSNRKNNLNVYRSLESLECRRLMTVPAIYSWSNILSDSNYANHNYTSADPGDSVTSNAIAANSYFSVRALVTYYNSSYNGEANQPFNIQLGNDSYTLSETANSTSLWGGRLENSNQYGDLDVNPLLTKAPLIIQGVAGGTSVITCSYTEIPHEISFALDRLIQVESGRLQIEGLTLKYGQALDNGTNNKETSSLGGGVLVNPGGALSLTNCVVSSNSAGSALISTNYSFAPGLNAAGGGLYCSPGSTISINGNNSFIGNVVKAGKGGTSGSTGLAGGNAYVAGIAIDAPVPDNITDSDYPTTMLSFNGGSVQSASFLNNRLNSQVASTGKVFNSGGTGGAGSGTGGAGGNAYGAGLYVGSGQLNLNGGSTNSPITFVGNQARGGSGAGTSANTAGANGTAYGAGVSFSPILVTPVLNSPSSGGIMQFSNNTAGGATSGIYLPTVETGDVGYTSANGPWTLRTAVALSMPLVATGMDLNVNLPSSTIALILSSTGSDTGSISVANSNSGTLSINGNGAVIDGSNLSASVFSFSSAHVNLSNLTITGGGGTGTLTGGGISSNWSTVNLSKVIVSDNMSENGGGVFNGNGALNLSSVTITKNNVVNGAAGGGIFSTGGTINIKNSKILNNTANQGGGAYLTGGTVTMIGGIVQGNTAIINGGGLMSNSSNSLKLTNVSVVSNSATSSTSYFGGGLYQNNGGTLSLSGTTVKNNTAMAGGGILCYFSTLIANNSNVSNNTATNRVDSGSIIVR